MARKRLTSAAIEKLENTIGNSASKPTSAVFGMVDRLLDDGSPNIVKRLKMTATGVTPTEDEPTILIPVRMEAIVYPKRFKVFYGGRGSGKSRSIASYLVEKARFKPSRIGCFREIQASIKESSFAELVDEITRKGHADEYRCVDGEITHHFTRSKFNFRGLWRNITAVKGYAGITDAFCEEAENISQVSWDTLIPTVRADGSEIIVAFNPNRDTDPTWQSFVEPYVSRMVDGIYEDDDIVVVNVNHIHNPWFTDELRQHMNQMRSLDYDRYLWVYEGMFNNRSDELVFGGKYVVEDFEMGGQWHGPYLGMDFGFSVDPTAMVSVYISDNDDGTQDLWIDHEHGGVNMEVTDTPAQMEKIPKAKTTRWHADCARPETISHIKRQGYDIYGCSKWAGSVEDGIAHMRGYNRIHVHTRCIEVAREFAMYSYKVDKLTGNVLTDVVDKYNHYIDAIRYALNDMIAQKGGPGILLRRRRR